MSNDNKELMVATKPKEFDYEQLDVIVALLQGNLSILMKLDNTTLKDVVVSINRDDKSEFEFTIEGEMLETAMKGLRHQIKARVDQLRAQIKLM